MDTILALDFPHFFLLTGALSFTVGRMVAVMLEWGQASKF